MGLSNHHQGSRPHPGKDSGSAEMAPFRPRLGLAVFHNDANPTNGLALIHGQRLRTFESRTALPSDGLWISTAQSGDVAQNFRPKNFLRSTLDALADDLGVNLRDAVEGIPNIALLLQQIEQIVCACYSWEDSRSAWSRPTLAEVLREAMPKPPEASPGILGPLKDALQSYSAIPDRVMVRSNPVPIRQYTLRHNRLEYALYLLSRPMPDPGAQWYVAQFRDVDEALSCSRPFLVEVALEFDAPQALDNGVLDFSRLAAFGSSSASRRGAGHLRRWVSQPELLWLSRRAHIHLGQALMCNSEPVSLDPEFNLPLPLRSDPLVGLSLAAGIVAEAHWVSLTLGRLKKRTHSGASSKFDEVFTPTSVWIRAYDRAYGYFMAEQAAKAGYEVVGYGYGAVTVEFDKNEPQRLLELADHLGVCHPNLVALQNRVNAGGEEPESAG